MDLKLCEIRQGTDTVIKYFHSLKRVWQDLDLFYAYEWRSLNDYKHHLKTIMVDRIYKFLADLNIEFDEVRGRKIGRKPLLSIGEVFSEVRHKESHWNVMLGKKNKKQVTLLKVLHWCMKHLLIKLQIIKDKENEKSRVWRDYCDKLGRTHETCWKLHGKSANWKSNKQGERSGSNRLSSITNTTDSYQSSDEKFIKS